MAKKNSSKTATQEAIKASEPRVQAYTGWQGVNFEVAPLGWNPLEQAKYDHRQVDLKANFLMVQNNINTTATQTLETRRSSIYIGKKPSNHTNAEFTGVVCIYNRWLFAVMHEVIGNDFKEFIVWRELTSDRVTEWQTIKLADAEIGAEPKNYVITEIGYYEKEFIALTMHASDKREIDPTTKQVKYFGEIFTGKINYFQTLVTLPSGIEVKSDMLEILDIQANSTQKNILRSPAYVERPGGDGPSPAQSSKPTISARGDLKSNTTGQPIHNDDGTITYMTTRVEACYTYINKFGSTLESAISYLYVSADPVTWHHSRYIQISGKMPANLRPGNGIIGVDVYVSLDNKQTKAFVGSVSFGTDADGRPKEAVANQDWSLTWLGAMQDISAWSNSQVYLPEENTTKGVSATHFANHDSKLYFWGDPQRPYRLWIGGVAGSELSIARGLGGAFVDIEPGTGIVINGTAKWKTASGANIVTMMCGNPNTNMVKRFNLVETNTTITNEISSKSYMYEEVSNVVGCNSRWGYGVYSDGLYSLTRYGLTLTTMAMEYNNQMRSEEVSAAIAPIFTERLGNRLKDARMVCINNIIYIVLSEDKVSSEPTNLDQVILVFDIAKKAWYTYTHDEKPILHGEVLLHAFAVDSDEFIEGLGIVTKDSIMLYPTTDIQEETVPDFEVLVETGELMAKQPKQSSIYIQQIEFLFDYFLSDPNDPPEVLIEGVDYYGRPFQITKKLNIKSRGHHGKTNLMRDYVEWIRVEKLVQSYRIRIKGRARFKLVNWNVKAYPQSNRIGLPYGYDAQDLYHDLHGRPIKTTIHHYIDDYNNLRRVIVS